MKLTCSQTELASALQLVGRAVSSRPSHPVLANVLLAADAATGRLSLTGFDLSLGIQASLPASVQSAGQLTLPARLLLDIVSRLASDSPLTLAASGSGAVITSLNGSYELQGLPAEDYPALPLDQSGTPVTIDASALLQGLRSTLFASSTDESKQLLTGVHLKLGSDGLECAATDGHRLAVLTLPHEAGADPFALTIPARSLKEMERLIGASGGDLHLHTGKGQAVITSADRILTTRILEGTYPAYRQLIPESFQRSIVLDRRAFMVALERVSVMADDKTNVVKLLADPELDSVTIRADAQDLGRASETLAAVITGSEITIAFNVRYLLEGLKAMDSGQVVLQANAPTTPVVLEPVGDDEGFTYLVMPVQVRV